MRTCTGQRGMVIILYATLETGETPISSVESQIHINDEMSQSVNFHQTLARLLKFNYLYVKSKLELVTRNHVQTQSYQFN